MNRYLIFVHLMASNEYNKEMTSIFLLYFAVVNVCGMTGIGKSYLVKHLALKMMKDKLYAGIELIYIDARYIYPLQDVLCAFTQYYSVCIPRSPCYVVVVVVVPKQPLTVLGLKNCGPISTVKLVVVRRQQISH